MTGRHFSTYLQPNLPRPSALNFASYSLTTPDFWAWNRIGSWDGPVDSNQNSRVCCRVSTRQLDGRPRPALARTRDFKLSAGDVELGSISGTRRVQCNVLDAKKVFSRG